MDAQAAVLRCGDLWHAPATRADEFEALCRRTTFPAGVGLPGRVWASGQPCWIPDVVKDPNFPRAPAATRAGLHGAFGFPIVVDGDVLGVIEAFSGAIQRPDDDLLRMLAAIGSQIVAHVPRGSRRRSRIRPSCASTTAFALTSPRPTPSRFVETNGSNTRSIIAGSMPTPSSHTST